jgi:capsular polysaccharide biosynthesis protein
MTQNLTTNDEIDLRPYLAALLKHKWLILILGVSFAVIGLVISLATPRTFSATSTLLFTRNRATLSLAQEFPTVNEPIDFRSRMEALLAIANSDALAQRTIQVMSDQLPDSLRSVEDLSDAVVTTSEGDSLLVKATQGDAETAANIANTWASELATTINLAYSGEQPLSAIQGKLGSARSDYEDAQKALEEFIRLDPRAAFEAQLKETRGLLDQESDNRVVLLTYYYLRSQTMDQVINNAQALKAQLESGSRSAAGSQGDALAVMWARMNALGIPPRTIQINERDNSQNPQDRTVTQIDGSTNPLYLQMVLPETVIDNTSSAADDVDALINLAEEEKSRADENIRLLSEEILASEDTPGDGTGSTTGPSLATTGARIQELSQQIEVARAEEERLKSARDLAWTAYKALLEKETEINNAALANNQVILTGPAIPPAEPDSRGTVLKTGIAALAGLFIGALIALYLEFRHKISS